MQNIIISAAVVAPLFIMMGAGYLLRRFKVIDERAIHPCNMILFRLLLPMLLFESIYTTNYEGLDGGMTALLLVIGMPISYIASYYFAYRFAKTPARRGAIAQGVARANIILFGMPLAVNYYGEGNIGVVFLAFALCVPLTNIFSVLVLEFSRGTKPNAKQILKSVVTNPLLIMMAAGYLFNVTGVSLPNIIMSAVSSMADAATPISFILIGASFTITSVKRNRLAITWATLGKLVLLPGAMITAGILLGLRNQELYAVLMAFATPTAVSSFPMAVAMGADGELADEIVVITTLFASITLFAFIAVLGALNLI